MNCLCVLWFVTDHSHFLQNTHMGVPLVIKGVPLDPKKTRIPWPLLASFLFPREQKHQWSSALGIEIYHFPPAGWEHKPFQPPRYLNIPSESESTLSKSFQLWLEDLSSCLWCRVGGELLASSSPQWCLLVRITCSSVYMVESVDHLRILHRFIYWTGVTLCISRKMAVCIFSFVGVLGGQKLTIAAILLSSEVGKTVWLVPSHSSSATFTGGFGKKLILIIID